ncbi:hypothetical protein ACFL1G_11920 [Planctomycetota bacterium]
MARKLQIMVLIIAAVVLGSCGRSKREKPIWEELKVTDLPPSEPNDSWPFEMIKTANFDVYIIEIPEANSPRLNDLWQMLTREQLQIADYRAFTANSFLAGLGRGDIVEQVDRLLLEAAGRTRNKVTVLIPEGQTQDVGIAQLQNQRSIFYISTSGSMTGATVGPGNIALRLKPEKAPGSVGLCNLNVCSVFIPPALPSLESIEERQKKNQFIFEPVTFNAIMRPGDFLVLGPQQVDADPSTLNSVFFSRKEPKPVVRIYLLLCTGVLF